MAKRRTQKTESVEAETVNSVESVEVDPVNLRALVDDVITDYCMRDHVLCKCVEITEVRSVFCDA